MSSLELYSKSTARVQLAFNTADNRMTLRDWISHPLVRGC